LRDQYDTIQRRPAEHASAFADAVFHRQLAGPAVDADRVEHLHGLGAGERLSGNTRIVRPRRAIAIS
jgi:hypothetical protein